MYSTHEAVVARINQSRAVPKERGFLESCANQVDNPWLSACYLVNTSESVVNLCFLMRNVDEYCIRARARPHRPIGTWDIVREQLKLKLMRRLLGVKLLLL